ncbi:hypothetical protein HOI26_02590 [Candidatus Woesearchaeota archaeon]|jgi:hypothetical protein|nr:hypothetical protein [Candidatus Woesearchaeota archaeon]MBT5739965.1 hypothetical protein [Candidatus Woesearchaeota archaeon]
MDDDFESKIESFNVLQRNLREINIVSSQALGFGVELTNAVILQDDPHPYSGGRQGDVRYQRLHCPQFLSDFWRGVKVPNLETVDQIVGLFAERLRIDGKSAEKVVAGRGIDKRFEGLYASWECDDSSSEHVVAMMTAGIQNHGELYVVHGPLDDFLSESVIGRVARGDESYSGRKLTVVQENPLFQTFGETYKMAQKSGIIQENR